ncbi:hypothetical protein D3C85_1024950 [compost metagenome]
MDFESQNRHMSSDLSYHLLLCRKSLNHPLIYKKHLLLDKYRICFRCFQNLIRSIILLPILMSSRFHVLQNLAQFQN